MPCCYFPGNNVYDLVLEFITKILFSPMTTLRIAIIKHSHLYILWKAPGILKFLNEKRSGSVGRALDLGSKGC